MEKGKTVPQYATISAVLLFVSAVFMLPVIVRQIDAIAGHHAISTAPLWLLTNLAVIGGDIWLGLNLMKQGRDKTVVLGIAVLAGAVLLQLILGFDPASMRYQRYTYSYYGGSDYRFSLWAFLPYLTEAAGYALLLVFAHFLLNTGDEQKHAQAKKLWFLPGALLAAKLPLSLLSLLLAHTSPALLVSGFSGIISFGLACAVMFTLMSWLAFPEGREAGEYHGDGYKSMIPHLLLCIFTLGIYQLIWICKVTKYLNARIDTEPAMKPWHQVVASMFVPFYMVYWTYKCAQRLDVAARELGAQSNLTLPCTILQVFSFCNIILPSILMQDKINTLALLESGEVAPNAPCMQNGPTWGGSAVPAAVVSAAPAVENPDELPEL